MFKAQGCALFPVLSLSVVLASCGGDGGAVDADACIVDTLAAQPQRRFLVGETYWLPELATTDECAKLRWTLADQPSANANEVHSNAAGESRFTPTVPGTYRFVLEQATDPDAHAVDLGVVDAAERPFHNLNYFPAGSVARVGDELWVANVQKPTVTRIDPNTMAVLGELPVGAWPVAIAWNEGMEFAVVAHRGSDTLGLIALATSDAPARLVDAIWVGDEPANVVLSPDSTRAYVSLKAEDAVAVVDLAERTRIARIAAVKDPLALAISPDGATLYVASHRSGHPSRFPFPDKPIAEERDLAVIDTEGLEVRDWWLDLGTTLTGLTMAPGGDRLYLSRLLNDTEVSLADTDGASFAHEIAILDPATGAVQRSADLTRQAGSGGFAVAPHQLVVVGDRVLVTAESSDLTLILNAETLQEQGRIATPGRPRAVTAIGNDVFVHGAQATTVTKIRGSEIAGTVQTTTDPRPDLVATGQAYFTGAGRGYAQTWSCNGCHVDGLSDTLIWNAGPFSGRKVSRPFFWLEGTYPLGWDGYLSSVDNYAFTVNTNVGIRPTTAEHQGLSAYLSSLMPPPPANGATRRDGSLSELGARGLSVYEGAAGCATCHPLPLTTSRSLLPSGVSEGPTDIPGLVGSYRLGVWLKLGSATNIGSAVDQVLGTFGDPGLSADDRTALDQFLQELTARDLIVLSSTPRPDAATAVATDQPVSVTFSQPLWADPQNLAHVWLRGPDGNPVAVDYDLAATGRHLSLRPTAALAPGSDYTIVINPELEAFDERTLWVADAAKPSTWEIPFGTAEAPLLRLAGDYLWTVDMPAPDFANLGFDPDTTIPTLVTLTATETESGAEFLIDYSEGLTLTRIAVADGDRLVAPPLPIPIGPSFADGSALLAELVDMDDDGIADFAEGTLTISGPGFLQGGVQWRLTRPATPGTCNEGADGALPVTLEFDADGVPNFSWGEDLALGFYILDPDAQPPAGPGQPVTGGMAYWALQLEEFPTGFAGPVTYGIVPDGAVDITSDVGGGDGPATLVSGQCYKASLVTTGFAQGSVTFAMP